MSGVSAFTDDQKRGAIERSRTIGVRAAAAELGVSASRITRWGQALNIERRQHPQGQRSGGHKSYHVDIKDRACRVARGVNISHAARVFGVSRGSVKRWLDAQDEQT